MRTGQKAAQQAAHTAEEALALGLLGLGRLLALLRGLALHGAGGLGRLGHGGTAAEGAPAAQTGRIGRVGQGVHTGASQHDEHGQNGFDLHGCLRKGERCACASFLNSMYYSWLGQKGKGRRALPEGRPGLPEDNHGK